MSSSIHFILQRPSGTSLLIQLSFNNRGESAADSQQYLMQAITQAIQNVTRFPLTHPQSAYRHPAMSPASTHASQSLFRSLSSMITPPPPSPPNPREAAAAAASEDGGGGAGDGGNMSALLNDFLRHSIEDHVTQILEQVQQRLSSIDEEKRNAEVSAEPTPTPTPAPVSPSASRSRVPPSSDSSFPHPPPLNTSQSQSASSMAYDDVESPPPLLETLSDPQLSRPYSSRASSSASSATPTPSSMLALPGPLRSYSEPSFGEQSPARQQALQSAIPPEDIIHRGVTCDGCSMCPLRGTRFKCAQCPDYDLCRSCHLVNATHGAHVPSHTFITFTQPRPDPLVRALEDFLRLILQSGFVSVRMIGGVPDDYDAMMHQGSRPAAKSVVDGLEKVLVDGSSAGMVCVVCQSELQAGEEVTFMPTPCHHIYHIGCITPWLEKHSECPMCRAKVKTVDEEEEEEELRGAAGEHKDDGPTDRRSRGRGSGAGGSFWMFNLVSMPHTHSSSSPLLHPPAVSPLSEPLRTPSTVLGRASSGRFRHRDSGVFRSPLARARAPVPRAPASSAQSASGSCCIIS